MKNILILCAHTDDEVGCAGTIARMHNEDRYNIKYIAFSDIALSLINEKKHSDAARNECHASMRVLGITNCIIDEIPVRHFPFHRQEILEKMIIEKSSFKPEVIFVPATGDIHQDHQVVTNEAIRAFKHQTILGYELPQNLIGNKNTAFMKLSQANMMTKIEAISKYESQMEKEFLQSEFIINLAKLRGIQCGAKYAESFEVIRMVWAGGLY